MTNNEAVHLICMLQQIEGAIDYSGECSVQVVIPLKNGKHLRLGVTDSDVAATQGLWFDQYEGLKMAGCPEGDLTKYFGAK